MERWTLGREAETEPRVAKGRVTGIERRRVVDWLVGPEFERRVEIWPSWANRERV